MPIRDIFVTLLILWTIPHILRTPWIGIIVWSWLAFMSPHRLCWGFAYGLPFSLVVGLTVLFSVYTSKEPKKMIWNSSTALMAAFLAWMLFTTFFAHYPRDAWPHFDKLWKIFLMTFVTIMLMQDKRRLQVLVAVMAMSVGFYGIKGGLFTIRSGGGEMVLGPRGSFMKTHGEIGMALAMTLPYLRYLQMHITDLSLLPKPMHRFLPKEIHGGIRIGFGFAIFLTGLAILGTQSRGAMLAGVMVALFLLLKSRQKFRVVFVMALVVPFMLTFMPQSWWDRMDTISADQHSMDRSSYKRTVSWGMAINMANHELTGGGYDSFREHEFDMYSSDTSAVADAHSIYFEVIGEHGWIGFILFMGLAMTTWFRASRVARGAKKHKRLYWLGDLARMSQVSMAAYATSGAFIGQAYFDLYYAIVAIVTLAEFNLARELKRIEATEGNLTPARPGPQAGRGTRTGPPPRRAPNPSWKAYGGPQRPHTQRLR